MHRQVEEVVEKAGASRLQLYLLIVNTTPRDLHIRVVYYCDLFGVEGYSWWPS